IPEALEHHEQQRDGEKNGQKALRTRRGGSSCGNHGQQCPERKEERNDAPTSAQAGPAGEIGKDRVQDRAEDQRQQIVQRLTVVAVGQQSDLEPTDISGLMHVMTDLEEFEERQEKESRQSE